MSKQCFIVCESCGDDLFYRLGDKNNVCKQCKKIATVDSEMERLVFFLNAVGVKTVASCKGRVDGFDFSQRNYPWVALVDDEVIKKKAEEVVKKYNTYAKKGEKWKLEHQQTISGWKAFIFPEDYTDRKSHGSINLFACFIAEYC